MAFIDDVKVALRISHTKLDAEIAAVIEEAEDELARLGVDEAKIVTTDPLISAAIKTYCKYSFASDMKMREGFFKSWEYQADCLRKSTGYMVEVEEDV